MSTYNSGSAATLLYYSNSVVYLLLWRTQLLWPFCDLRSRCGRYILPLWFLLLLLFSSPILGGCRFDVHHTSIHDVALMQI